MSSPVSFSVVAPGWRENMDGPFGELMCLLLLFKGSKGSHGWMTYVGI